MPTARPSDAISARPRTICMAIIDLQGGALSARISTTGGLLLHYSWLRDGLTIPLLRPATDNADALSSACYPLVPFGNRVRGNRFTFKGHDYSLRPNRDWDPHYLHGSSLAFILTSRRPNL